MWLPGWSEGAVGGDGAAEGGTPIGKLALPLIGSSCGPSAACEGVRGYPAARAGPTALKPFPTAQTSETHGASEVSENPCRSPGRVAPWDRTWQSPSEPPASGPRSLVPSLPLRASGSPGLHAEDLSLGGALS